MKNADHFSQTFAALTPRQLQILELVSARRSLKAIAAQLECSESTVNQNIKVLKLRFGANSLTELFDIYRDRVPDAKPMAGSDEDPCRNSACTISVLPESGEVAHPGVNDERSEPIVFSDALSVELRAPWEVRREHSLVPGVLNGRSAGLVRTGVIVAMTFMLFASVLLAIAAGQTLSDLIR